LREYEVDPDDLSAETVAAKVGLPPEQLLQDPCRARGPEWNPFSGNSCQRRVGLQNASLAGQGSEIDMVPLKEVQAVTGYIRGGVTALACKKDYPVYIDELRKSAT